MTQYLIVESLQGHTTDQSRHVMCSLCRGAEPQRHTVVYLCVYVCVSVAGIPRRSLTTNQALICIPAIHVGIDILLRTDFGF